MLESSQPMRLSSGSSAQPYWSQPSQIENARQLRHSKHTPISFSNETFEELAKQNSIGKQTNTNQISNYPKAKNYKPVLAGKDSIRLHGIIDAFVKVCQRWCLDENDQMKLLGFSSDDFFGKLILKGIDRALPHDIDDRATCVVGIGMSLFSLFGESAEAEIHWLNHPRTNLQNRSPLAYMLEGRMENIFTVVNMVKHERGL